MGHKVTFPMKEEKIGKKSLENIPCLPEEISAERSVSVRKRMEDEMKKEMDIKPEGEESKDAAAEVSDNLIEACKEATEETDKEEPVKIKSENLKHKDRQYRSSKDEASKSSDSQRESESEREKRKYEEEKYEKRKREERQRDRT